MRILALLIASVLAHAQDLDRLRADLDYLCSDALQGRLSLSPAADQAARYIAASFEKSGLTGPFLQSFPLAAYDPDRSRTHMTLHRAGQTIEIPAQEFRAASWKEVEVHAQVVFAGFGITAPESRYDDYAGIDVSGKIVLLFDYEPRENNGHTRYGYARAKLENARRHGAVAVLTMTQPLRKPPAPVEPTPQRANAPRQTIAEDTIPVFTVNAGLAAQLLSTTGSSPADIQTAIESRLKPASRTLPDTTLDLATAPANLERGMSANAYGLLEGSDPALRGETILITAHYDHLGVHNGMVYRGANDNTSGTVAVMELARMFAADPRRPRRSILFMVFGSEEEGMLGSNYYVEHPLRPLAATRAVLNLDMIARDEAHIPQSRGVVDIPADTTNQINLVGSFYSPDLRAVIMEQNRATGLDISTKFDRDHDLNVLFRCDHIPFLVAGVPAVWFFGGFHPGYHEPVDTIDRLDFPKLEKVTRLAYLTARSLADAPHPPRFRP